MTESVSLNALPSVMAMLRDTRYHENIANMQINPKDWELVTGSAMWLATDRQRVENTLNQLIFWCVGNYDVSPFPSPR